MRSPRSPAPRATWMAAFTISTASGYSDRTYMYPWRAPIANAPMVIPSMTLNGSPSRMDRSMKAPGSPSSALQTTYFGSPAASRQNPHF